MKGRLFIGLCIAVGCFCLASCGKEKVLPQLSWSKSHLWDAPESVYQTLKSLPFPEEMSEKNRALYALLMTQALYQTGRPIASDSLIQVAMDYYLVHGNAEEKATVYLYKGYLFERMGRDQEAMYLYKHAEETVRTVKELRLHFLVYTALGHLNEQYALYEKSLEYYRKALSLNLSMAAWKSMGGAYVFAPLYLAQGTTRYNEQVKQMHDKFAARIARMDFASQERIYYQRALKERDKGEWEAAAVWLLKAHDRAATPDDRYRYEAELASIYQAVGKQEQADSLRRSALQASDPALRASIYKEMYKTLLERDSLKANRYMLLYIEEMDLLFTSANRAALLEIEQKYDYTTLLRQNGDYRSRWAITLLTTVTVVCMLAMLLWVSWKFFRRQKLEMLSNYKKEASLLQQQIDALQEQMEETQGETKSLQEQLQQLEHEKKNKEVRIRQLELTFRSKHISLPIETVEAVQVYLQVVNDTCSQYHPAEDRSKLAYWLNISHQGWANRLDAFCPSLTNGEKDICYLYALGLSFDTIALLLGVQARSVDRVVYRICRKMKLEQGGKDEFTAQLAKL